MVIDENISVFTFGQEASRIIDRPWAVRLLEFGVRTYNAVSVIPGRSFVRVGRASRFPSFTRLSVSEGKQHLSTLLSTVLILPVVCSTLQVTSIHSLVYRCLRCVLPYRF